MLVGIQSRTEYGVTHLTLDEDNYGELVIPDFGTEYTEVILIPTVVKYNYSASTIKGVDYKYAADIETSDSDDDDSAGDDDDSGGGCSL